MIAHGEPLWAGLDIGGSTVHAVLVDGSARVVASARLPTVPGGSGVLATATAALEQATARAGTEVARLAGLGVGVPGLVDPRAGAVRHAVNLGLDDDGLALQDGLAAATGVPVTVENDVNAAALGAARALALDAPDLAYLSLGTGIAAGLVLGGRLRRGVRGAAGEVGHVPLDPTGPLCPCGQHGCLEVLASGSAIARLWPGGLGVPAAVALFTAADAGDAEALRVREAVAGHVAAAVRMLVLTVDVELVVLGGGVAEVGEPLAAAVRQRLHRVAAGSRFLRSLDLPGRVAMTPADRPVAALGAALVGQERGGVLWRS